MSASKYRTSKYRTISLFDSTYFVELLFRCIKNNRWVTPISLHMNRNWSEYSLSSSYDLHLLRWESKLQLEVGSSIVSAWLQLGKTAAQVFNLILITYFLLSWTALSYPMLSCPMLPCPMPSYPIFSYAVLSCPMLPCPILCCPVLSFHAMSYPIPFYPIWSCCLLLLMICCCSFFSLLVSVAPPVKIVMKTVYHYLSNCISITKKFTYWKKDIIVALPTAISIILPAGKRNFQTFQFLNFLPNIIYVGSCC